MEDKALPIPIPRAPKPILLNAPGLTAISLNLGCAKATALNNKSDMKKYLSIIADKLFFRIKALHHQYRRDRNKHRLAISFHYHQFHPKILGDFQFQVFGYVVHFV